MDHKGNQPFSCSMKPRLKSTKLWGKLNFEIDDDVYPIRKHFSSASKDKVGTEQRKCQTIHEEEG